MYYQLEIMRFVNDMQSLSIITVWTIDSIVLYYIYYIHNMFYTIVWCFNEMEKVGTFE